MRVLFQYCIAIFRLVNDKGERSCDRSGNNGGSGHRRQRRDRIPASIPVTRVIWRSA
ncbi:hypothetical protein HanXRQr2_Chr16g0744921 [Helianthus annuus]|uniref:Uncharacterized protein n=1 Tax=Helianthus annuus TaxID=4232 RepID=A0A9K3DQZ0_HELAN|nr:hypothetical protein HanXRQr2_Chr16g0744921 [Helianthus annuus]KAJ0437880.1 hypothetical protein HanHA300_Chr16g0607411 [Helianthus annuus]KAJ0442454.1 hypothetical protein HanIR_Chr16g0809501 [Helianthus annuus]KAJ0460205.1 hypothetical protein HanHA89_Chr16g0658011 [Helianthus annuus]KAJ0640644.1 hypothetical protein HanLR1_Chr16g0617971 [Helianthus annuus]